MTNFREILTAVGLAVIITAGAFFYHGWLRWQNRPPQTVNNIQQISGDNATVTQQTEKAKDRRFLTFISGGKEEINIGIGYLW